MEITYNESSFLTPLSDFPLPPSREREAVHETLIYITMYVARQNIQEVS